MLVGCKDREKENEDSETRVKIHKHPLAHSAAAARLASPCATIVQISTQKEKTSQTD